MMLVSAEMRAQKTKHGPERRPSRPLRTPQASPCVQWQPSSGCGTKRVSRRMTEVRTKTQTRKELSAVRTFEKPTAASISGMESMVMGMLAGSAISYERVTEVEKMRSSTSGKVVFSSLWKPVNELPPDLRTSRSRIPLLTVPTILSFPADASTVTATVRFSSPSRTNE